MEKTYHLIHIYFGDFRKGEGNSYEVYEYKKSRRFTSGQARKYIKENNRPALKGNLKGNAAIFSKFDIIKEHGLDPSFATGIVHSVLYTDRSVLKRQMCRRTKNSRVSQCCQ